MNKKLTSQKTPKTDYTRKEWDWPEEATKTGKKWPKELRKKYVKELFSRGILDPPRQPLAEKFGVCRRVLFEDFEEVYNEGLDPNEVQMTKVQIGNAMKNAIIEVAAMVATHKGKDKLQAINTLAGVSEKYTDFLEKFDVKTPGEIDSKEVIIRWDMPEIDKEEETGVKEDGGSNN